MSNIGTPPHSDLTEIRARVQQKRLDYVNYNFSAKKNDILKTFFDLSQEFDSLADFYRICVTVTMESFGVGSRLYLLNPDKSLALVCDTEHGIFTPPAPCPEHIVFTNTPYETEEAYVVPILGRPIQSPDAPTLPESKVMHLLGLFEVYPLAQLTASDKFFLTKYTNRIGYNLRKRLLSQQNIQHLQFINNLVSDIEHNVIIPNMYYKYLFKQLKKRIDLLCPLIDMIEQYQADGHSSPERCQQIVDQVSAIRSGLLDSYQEISKHHTNLSLFLESLFRRDHFEAGRLVLHQQMCKLETDIILPQLSHYQKRMTARGITIENPGDMKGEEIELQVDFGLLSQVYANLFSNVIKYAETIIDHNGHPRKAVAYGRMILPNHFGPGQDGIKLNVFSTGHPIPDTESSLVFKDGFMGTNCTAKNSRGHGLAFIKYVIELHGGQVGYEFTEEGNNFYFILPFISITR